MDIFQAIVLGLVQGLGEFLPISSTAHLILVPYFTGWQDPGLAFDVALHLGTLVAVVAFFWKDWLNIFKLALQNKSKVYEAHQIYQEGYNKNLLWLLMVASLPGALFGFLFGDKIESIFRSPLLVAFMQAVVGLVLFLVDKYAAHKKELNNLKFKDALWIGLSQALAIVPGVSRSGATMTSGLALGFSRQGAARFSFLLSTPIIFGAALVKMPELLREGISLPIIFGILTAAVSGFLAIKFMLRLIQKIGYAPFFYYRLLLALFVVGFYFWK